MLTPRRTGAPQHSVALVLLPILRITFALPRQLPLSCPTVMWRKASISSRRTVDLLVSALMALTTSHMMAGILGTVRANRPERAEVEGGNIRERSATPYHLQGSYR